MKYINRWKKVKFLPELHESVEHVDTDLGL